MKELSAEKNLSLAGIVRIKSPDGSSLKGQNMIISVQLDSCAEDSSMPQDCRIKESNEKNNILKFNLNLADEAVQK
jgi:hypothetical protein